MSCLISTFMSAVIYGWANELTPQHLENLFMFTSSKLGKVEGEGFNMHINEHVVWTASNYTDAFGASFGDGVSSNSLTAIWGFMLVWITIVSPSGSSSCLKVCVSVREWRQKSFIFVFLQRCVGEWYKNMFFWGETGRHLSAPAWANLRFSRSSQCFGRSNTNGIVTQGFVVSLVIYQGISLFITKTSIISFIAEGRNSNEGSYSELVIFIWAIMEAQAALCAALCFLRLE